METEPIADPFPRIDVEKTHWIDIFVDFMLQNKPCILKASATENWKCRKSWILDANDDFNKKLTTPNFDYFSNTYGDLMVPLVDEDRCEQTVIKLLDYMEYAKSDDCRNGLKYLKDWHFQKDSGTSYDVYGLPSILRLDWINNEKWSDGANPFGDYRFVYFGVEDTWTIFHSDVMSSYSWSANICGKKLWYFVPIQNEYHFKTGRDTFIPDIRKKPDKWKDAKVASFIQEPGEVVFVPSNWYHQVHNKTIAISINHNFLNASNIDHVFRMICNRLDDVRKEIEDVKEIFTEGEFEDQCQIILQADIRVNFQMLSQLLNLVIEDRAQKVTECWVCFKHRSIFDCKKDNLCMDFMKKKVKSQCKCADPEIWCENCVRFINMYDLSCAAQCLSMLIECAKIEC